MASETHVRILESLRLKIGEAKDLPLHTSGQPRDTLCKVALDQEHIFSTAVIEKSSNPFYGEEFKCEIPRKFRHLSFYVCDKSNKTEKILGKVALKKDDLPKYQGKDYWFPLKAVSPHTEVQGKVHLELTLVKKQGGECRILVKILEGQDLPVINGACNPHATVELSRGKTGKHKSEVKKTAVKKKTTSPVYNEQFYFTLDKKGQNHERQEGNPWSNFELRVSLWHDDSKVSRPEMFSSITHGVFLGELKLQLKDLDLTKVQRAWYFLQPKGTLKPKETNLGSLRIKLCYHADHVFPSQQYDVLKNLLLKSPNVKPVTSSAAFILGEMTEIKEDIAQPLVRVFYEEGQIVELIGALADYEISLTTDPNTIFRGTTLATKCVDELMKHVGHHYLQDTLSSIIDQIYNNHKPCEIDPKRLKEQDILEQNMRNLETYIEQIFQAIVYSSLYCPLLMCEVFYSLKEAAVKFFPENKEIRYHVISGFVFLRFFAPAILGPRLFHLRTDNPDPETHRTLTLISKTIQSLGNIVCAKTHAFGYKEDYMVPLFKKFTDTRHMDEIRQFLDIISSLTRMHSTSIEAPIMLKEGFLIKRAQGRRKWGRKNFKRRYFILTNHSLSYYKDKGTKKKCDINIGEILAVEDLQENSFTRKYMFQVVQPQRVLYIQAGNCVEEKEWKDVLNKVCTMNQDRLKTYHPGAFLKGHWLCCKSKEETSVGCSPVSKALPAGLNIHVDLDRELEKLHFLFYNNLTKLESMQDSCTPQDSTEDMSTDSVSGDMSNNNEQCYPSSRLETLKELKDCVLLLEQEHRRYSKMLEEETVVGSAEAPFGDEGYWKTSQSRLSALQ